MCLNVNAKTDYKVKISVFSFKFRFEQNFPITLAAPLERIPATKCQVEWKFSTAVRECFYLLFHISYIHIFTRQFLCVLKTALWTRSEGGYTLNFEINHVEYIKYVLNIYHLCGGTNYEREKRQMPPKICFCSAIFCTKCVQF